MAMVVCTECGKEKSGDARTCPHCGFVVKSFFEKLLIKGAKLYVYALIISVAISSVRLGFCTLALLAQSCHSCMFLAGIQDNFSFWMLDKSIRA